ncbi:hypothetical protein [Desulfovibrio oxyclinae]|uniref:hypothetical protein n=1 Tax=Desulfovibrio oxyclinae TaxID=63560 RepID=UPI000370D198|nr:hypothetical protein [Desulfovibrio oxyclinae]
MFMESTTFVFLSDCPEGYDTVLGYLAKRHPDLLDLIDKEPEATTRDGFWLMHRCKERGIKRLRVKACPFLQAFGITEVWSYPIGLLKERFSLYN